MPAPTTPPAPPDPHRERRRALLAGIAGRLREAGIETAFGPLETYRDFYGALPAGTAGLVCEQPPTTARLQVTAIRVRRTLPPGQGGLSPDRRSWVRDADVTYDLDGDGEPAFEVTMLEDPDDGLGHSRDTSAQRTVTADEQAVVDAARLWYGYRHTLRATPPAADPRRERARLRREVERRDAAAAQPDLRTDVAGALVPAGDALAGDLDRLDPALLCWHFPRDRGGRYARRAVVALARYGPDPGKRGPWLTARVRDGALALGVEPLIGVNQDHRWDATPWLWSGTGRDATAADRWQVAGPEQARPLTDLLDAYDLGAALEAAGVRVDGDVAALLDGFPTRYLRAAHTDAWVAALYTGLARSAPWRFAAAYDTWRRERAGLGRPATGPIPLFGLTGLNQQRRPMLALDHRGGVPELRMVWTGSNARLSRALWERPADLDAALAGLATPVPTAP
ncbi:hypothetical protein RB614_04970 [Phytohabitans sp. ZYX-F-186]|uniref:Uncharacterized protein n=1 Tax=Phytohabitans maris TaxID=3071409 RepID=A0ABU0Z9Y6_9ACTN|nr:hypothetical protein [Phytohabitans sp. ZYX-F-186]MDQ7903871.1 hypothetical protein [Phytohabitans sp. ZYX-F-186]